MSSFAFVFFISLYPIAIGAQYLIFLFSYRYNMLIERSDITKTGDLFSTATVNMINLQRAFVRKSTSNTFVAQDFKYGVSNLVPSFLIIQSIAFLRLFWILLSPVFSGFTDFTSIVHAIIPCVFLSLGFIFLIRFAIYLSSRFYKSFFVIGVELFLSLPYLISILFIITAMSFQNYVFMSDTVKFALSLDFFLMIESMYAFLFFTFFIVSEPIKSRLFLQSLLVLYIIFMCSFFVFQLIRHLITQKAAPVCLSHLLRIRQALKQAQPFMDKQKRQSLNPKRFYFTITLPDMQEIIS